MTTPLMRTAGELATPWRFRLAVLMAAAGVAGGALCGAVLELLLYGRTFPILGALAGAFCLAPVQLLVLGVLCALPRSAALNGLTGPALAFLVTALGQYLLLGMVLDDPGAFRHPPVLAGTAATAGIAALGTLLAVRAVRRTLPAGSGQP
ncbi:hypothetical protein ACIRBX_13055 [Kitasatospora sp. NPDC096147]|uniref:hypothetical protein n=1 Tax=Kitasatospora sp. NPDC096147 TaxID=3364093 RepID=UPI003826CE8A